MVRQNLRFKMAAVKKIISISLYFKANRRHETQMMISFIIQRSQPIKIVEKSTPY